MAPRIQPTTTDQHRNVGPVPKMKSKLPCGPTVDLTTQTYEQRWSEESLKTTVDQWKLTAQEQQQLRTLQKRLRDVQHWKNNPQELVRYLRGPGHFDQGMSFLTCSLLTLHYRLT